MCSPAGTLARPQELRRCRTSRTCCVGGRPLYSISYVARPGGNKGVDGGSPPPNLYFLCVGGMQKSLNFVPFVVPLRLEGRPRHMARPHPTLAVADSDRTLILQRRGRCNTSSKRSAYFADSDTSSACGEHIPAAREVKPASRTPATAATATTPSGGSSRTGGRWILEGIRRSQQGQTRETPTIRDEQDRASVFYGSVRFPASRVALWYVDHPCIYAVNELWGAGLVCSLVVLWEALPSSLFEILKILLRISVG